MTERLGLKSWATGALVLAAVSACAAGDSEPADSANSPIVASSAPSPPETSSTPTSPAESASANATRTVREYFSTIDELAQNPGADLRALDAVTTSIERTAEKEFLREQHRRGEHQVGDTLLANLEIQSVNLSNSDPHAGRVPTVVIDVCWDVTNVDVLRKDGTSVVSPNRPDTGWTRYAVANYEFAADPSGAWRVATARDLERPPCVAS
ncbi:hypothetical protein [Nocardioides sp. W7]|uniref:hypothetical protein n=1 Tax=Nocardioides sp. W7 TaxID=2931390 RepID=UPI001FCFEFB7|nr:hypothetical protein [Nocardioides sp. W7]